MHSFLKRNAYIPSQIIWDLLLVLYKIASAYRNTFSRAMDYISLLIRKKYFQLRKIYDQKLWN